MAGITHPITRFASSIRVAGTIRPSSLAETRDRRVHRLRRRATTIHRARPRPSSDNSPGDGDTCRPSRRIRLAKPQGGAFHQGNDDRAWQCRTALWGANRMGGRRTARTFPAAAPAAANPPAAANSPAAADSPAEGKPASPILVIPGPNKMTIASDDVKALDEFQAMLQNEITVSNGPMTVYYLKYAKAQDVADELDRLLAGGVSAETESVLTQPSARAGLGSGPAPWPPVRSRSWLSPVSTR